MFPVDDFSTIYQPAVHLYCNFDDTILRNPCTEFNILSTFDIHIYKSIYVRYSKTLNRIKYNSA